MNFADKLRAQAERGRLSQAEVADRVGVSQSQMSKWFRGVNTPDLYQAMDLARVLGVSVDYLANDAIAEPPPPLTREEGELLSKIREIGIVEASARLHHPRGREGIVGARPAVHPEDRTKP